MNFPLVLYSSAGAGILMVRYSSMALMVLLRVLMADRLMSGEM